MNAKDMSEIQKIALDGTGDIRTAMHDAMNDGAETIRKQLVGRVFRPTIWNGSKWVWGSRNVTIHDIEIEDLDEYYMQVVLVDSKGNQYDIEGNQYNIN